MLQGSAIFNRGRTRFEGQGNSETARKRTGKLSIQRVRAAIN
jgi:hypothetical protein